MLPFLAITKAVSRDLRDELPRSRDLTQTAQMPHSKSSSEYRQFVQLRTKSDDVADRIPRDVAMHIPNMAEGGHVVAHDREVADYALKFLDVFDCEGGEPNEDDNALFEPLLADGQMLDNALWDVYLSMQMLAQTIRLRIASMISYGLC